MDEKKPEKKRRTDRLENEEHKDIPIAGGTPFGTSAEGAKAFIPLPTHLSRVGQGESAVRWRIALADLGPNKISLGMDVLGDVVLGRGKTGMVAPDLDMEPYDAHKLGVSRRHALLRPTANSLYVIDLGSTNGTFHNGVRLGPGVARVLAHNDTLSIGNLSFAVKIIEKPKIEPDKKREQPKVVKVDKPDDTKPFESTPEGIAQGLPPGSPRKLSAPMADEEEISTLIVRPAALRVAAKQPPGEPSEDKQKEAVKEPEKPRAERLKAEVKPSALAAEEKKEAAKEPEKPPAGTKAEAKPSDSPKPAEKKAKPAD